MSLYADLINDIKVGGEARLKSFGQSILSALKAIGIDLAGGKISVPASTTTAAADNSELEAEIKDLKARLAKLEKEVGENNDDLDDFEERLAKLEKSGGTPVAGKPAEPPKATKRDKSGKDKKKATTTEESEEIQGP